MKFLINTVLLVTIFATNTIAQNFVYTPSQHRVDQISSPSSEQFDIYVTTPNPDAIQFKWELVSNSFPSSWVYNMCHYNYCFLTIPVSGTMNAISLTEAQDGQYGYFKLYLTTEQNYGSGLVKIYVYDANDIYRGDTISFLVNNPITTGVNEAGIHIGFSVYPNPVSHQFIVKEFVEGQEFELMNIMGEIVRSGVWSESSNTISVVDIPKGVYLLRTKNSAGVNVQKIVVE